VELKRRHERRHERRHILYDVWPAEGHLLETIAPWRERLPAIAAAAGATILDQAFHQFQPRGMTGFLLLAESHLSVHTWPEAGLAAIDIFTCGAMDTEAIIAQLRCWLKPERERVTLVERGEVG